jgi:hypothetical protein
MDQTTLVIIFLAFVSLNAVLNAALLFAAHKALGAATAKATKAMQGFQRRREPREWLQAMAQASAQAVNATEKAKRRMPELELALGNVQAKYDRMLVTADNKLEQMTTDISVAATQLQDISHVPGRKLTACGERIRTFLRRFDPARDS